MDDLKIWLYCAREGRRYKNWMEIYAVHIKFVEAEKTFCQNPKFGGRFDVKDRKLRESAMGREESI